MVKTYDEQGERLNLMWRLGANKIDLNPFMYFTTFLRRGPGVAYFLYGLVVSYLIVIFAGFLWRCDHYYENMPIQIY